MEKIEHGQNDIKMLYEKSKFIDLVADNAIPNT